MFVNHNSIFTKDFGDADKPLLDNDKITDADGKVLGVRCNYCQKHQDVSEIEKTSCCKLTICNFCLKKIKKEHSNRNCIMCENKFGVEKHPEFVSKEKI